MPVSMVPVNLTRTRTKRCWQLTKRCWKRARVCGVIQGLRAGVLSFGLGGLARGASSLGDVQSVRAGERLIVFQHTEALTLVSISDREDGNHNEAWLRLQLEYVYSQVLFILTVSFCCCNIFELVVIC